MKSLEAITTAQAGEQLLGQWETRLVLAFLVPDLRPEKPDRAAHRVRLL